VLAELMGRVDGLCKGLGGSMHLVDVEHGLLGATGVVGGNIPMALGSALAARMRGSDAVAVVFFGDGAVQAGQFNESINIATLWKLPVVFVCENNGFAEFSPRSSHTNVERVSDVVAPYDLPRETVDGNDLPAVWSVFGRMLAGVRAGEGPALLECLTHRLRGHYEGDPDHYREAVSKAEWQEKDPILRLQRQGAADGWLAEGDPAELEAAARAEVDEAVETARRSPFPDEALAASLVRAGGMS
jgi:pyruvate dehydrogenase E1 component alpha subunit